MSRELEHVKKVSADKMPGSPIYSYVLEDVQIIGATKGSVVARLTLSDKHINSKNGLHGSVSLTIVDWMGGLAITTHDLGTSTGVSLDVHVTFQSSAKVGEEIEIEGVAERVGRTVAFTRVNIYKVEGGERSKLLVSGSHTKYVKT